jgi:hypothetical protein
MIYAGSCHCKNVRYTVDMNIETAITCNCSICSKKGHILAFSPIKNFKLLSGEESLTTYLFNKKNIQHIFCKTCGVSSFGKGTMPDGTQMAAINIRCLDDFEKIKVPIRQVDGKSF